MLKIDPRVQRQIPVAVTDSEGTVIGAQLVAEDTYEVITFEIDQTNTRVSGLIARGFIDAQGHFQYQPYNFERYMILNEMGREGPELKYAAFVETYGGDATKICAQQFLEYLAATKQLPALLEAP